jgi:hypothetical protein
MPKIETVNDWWGVVEEFWEQLVSMTKAYHPGSPIGAQLQSGQPADLDLHITAPGAEDARRRIQKALEKEQEGKTDPTARLFEAREKKDWRALRKIFGDVWFGIPESMGAHSIPGFGALCDLCSEDWVFQEILGLQRNLDNEDMVQCERCGWHGSEADLVGEATQNCPECGSTWEVTEADICSKHAEALAFVQQHAPNLEIFEHEPGTVIVNVYVLRALIVDYIQPKRTFGILRGEKPEL